MTEENYLEYQRLKELRDNARNFLEDLKETEQRAEDNGSRNHSLILKLKDTTGNVTKRSKLSIEYQNRLLDYSLEPSDSFDLLENEVLKTAIISAIDGYIQGLEKKMKEL